MIRLCQRCGASDKIGAYPAEQPVTLGDLAAAVFWRFGRDYAHEIHDPLGHKFQLAAGKPITSPFPSATAWMSADSTPFD